MGIVLSGADLSLRLPRDDATDSLGVRLWPAHLYVHGRSATERQRPIGVRLPALKQLKSGQVIGSSSLPA
jgi:hypothetical protein